MHLRETLSKDKDIHQQFREFARRAKHESLWQTRASINFINDLFKDIKESTIREEEMAMELNEDEVDEVILALANDLKKMRIEPKEDNDLDLETGLTEMNIGPKTGDISIRSGLYWARFLQRFESLSSLSEFNSEEWLMCEKPAGTRSLMVIIPNKCIVMYENGQVKTIQYNPLQKYLCNTNTPRSVFDCITRQSNGKTIVTILDVLYLEGKLMFEIPAEVRNFFLFDRLSRKSAWKIDFQELSMDKDRSTSSNGNFIEIEGNACLQINLISLMECNSQNLDSILMRTRRGGEFEGVLLISKQGEYNVAGLHDNVLLLKTQKQKVFEANNNRIALKFSKSSKELNSRDGNFKMKISSKQLNQEFSFSNEDSDTKTKSDKIMEEEDFGSSFFADDSFSGKPKSNPEKSEVVQSKYLWTGGGLSSNVRLKNGKVYSIGLQAVSKLEEMRYEEQDQTFLGWQGQTSDYKFWFEILGESNEMPTSTDGCMRKIQGMMNQVTIQELNQLLQTPLQIRPKHMEAELSWEEIVFRRLGPIIRDSRQPVESYENVVGAINPFF